MNQKRIEYFHESGKTTASVMVFNKEIETTEVLWNGKKYAVTKRYSRILFNQHELSDGVPIQSDSLSLPIDQWDACKIVLDR